MALMHGALLDDGYVRPPFKLTRPSASMAHNMVQSMVDEERKVAVSTAARVHRDAFFNAYMREDRATLLVEHDWAGLINESGDVRLPSQNCMFEFLVNNSPVLWWKSDDALMIGVLVRGEGREPEGSWVILVSGAEVGDSLPNPVSVIGVHPAQMRPVLLANFLLNQIRAMCIALDAEIIVKELIRAPHRLNAQREKKGRVPLSSYHVVKLAHRVRADALESEPGSSGRRLRLHFVRGHWRHFDTSKTWVRWHMRGNPDLGRIEKEYRL